ncbi:chemotaxis protein CheD, partial [Agrobacterium sp. S2]|nr:chemotaxis protein CheD [Agrobacterium sp. S2]MBM7329272.1 chemotaxis protein CheD [Agrobacterium sp. S2]
PLSGAETQKTVAMETRPVPAPKPVANDIEFF